MKAIVHVRLLDSFVRASAADVPEPLGIVNCAWGNVQSAVSATSACMLMSMSRSPSTVSNGPSEMTLCVGKEACR